MSGILQAELAATCNAIGYYNPKTKKYYVDENTLETIKDIIRYLRRDDENHEIRRFFGETNVLESDLLPIITNYPDNVDLFDVVLRLLVNLTTPPLLLWNEEMPKEKIASKHFLKIEEHLQRYKQAFADEKVWIVLCKKLTQVLQMDIMERGDETNLIVERILILIRNILYICSESDMKHRLDNDANIHDQNIWALHQSGMIDIIMYMVCSESEKLYHMHLMEVLYFMLRQQNSVELAQAASERNMTEKQRDEAELLAIRHKESQQRHEKLKTFTESRHSRFGGTYVMNSMKSLDDQNSLICYKHVNNLININFDSNKIKTRIPKNRAPVTDEVPEHRSAFSIRLLLKKFCVEFLNGAYNTVMRHIKGVLLRSKGQEHDETYYLWALRFFMEFNRNYKFQVKFISETMSLETFHFVQQQIEKHFDMMTTDKVKVRLWSRRLHFSMKAYKELLLTVTAIDKSPDDSLRDFSSVLKSNIFYVVEYRELILNLLVSYDEVKMSYAFLIDLIETQHIFLKLFETFCSKQGNLLVQKRKNNLRRKKPKNKQKSEMNLDSIWDKVAPQLLIVLERSSMMPVDVVPFDASSDVPIDQQRSEAMKKIQTNLRSENFETALGLLRASREIWPENECFGNLHNSPKEEMTVLHDIFFAELGNSVLFGDRENHGDEQQSNDDEEEEEEQYQDNVEFTETNLSFNEFEKRLAHPKIVRACGIVLTKFEKNSVSVNHYLVKLLHRIAWNCKMHSMIFQLSIFRTFQQIFLVKYMTQYSELVKFARYIMRKFFDTAEKNKKVFMEVLFWKNSKEAFDIEGGYGSYEKQEVTAPGAWSELEEEELRILFKEYQEQQITEDVVDWLLKNIINSIRTRRSVIKKLKEMGLLSNYSKKNYSQSYQKKKDENIRKDLEESDSSSSEQSDSEDKSDEKEEPNLKFIGNIIDDDDKYSSSSSDDEFSEENIDNLKALEEHKSDSKKSDSEQELLPHKSFANLKKAKRKRIVTSDSEDENVFNTNENSNEETNNKNDEDTSVLPVENRKKKTRILDSDDDD